MSEEQVQETQETTQEVSQENTSEVQIPEYIPEKFWDTDRNEIKVEELGASYKALEQKFGMRTEDLTKQLREDMEAERKSSVPESYEVRLPEIPQDVEITVDPEQELVKSWTEICKSHGLSQEVFDQGVAAFVNNEIAGLPNLQEEMGKLGDNAKERIEAADLWSKKYLSTDAYNAIANMASTAEGVKALEEIMGLSSNKPLPNNNTVVDVELDERDLQSMMQDPRYWKEGSKDQAYIRKVTDLYQKKYG
tara:strand:- start:13539 stop:14288 length:750 start_codon:yes stop_codon:yes gene_type:complete